jgi:energy-coupling factor transporter ATP-binding protein EcfA2
MKRVALSRVLAAVRRLPETRFKRAGALLPGFLALKRKGLTDADWTAIPPAAFSQFVDDLFRIQDAPDPGHPFFNALNGKWRAANWPLGSLQTRFKDTTPLAKKRKLRVEGSGQNYRWKLEPGYEKVLDDYVEADGKIPFGDFVAWMYRERKLDDERTLAELKRAARAELNLTDAEFARLFRDDDGEEDAEFFTDEDWDPADLTAELPARSEDVEETEPDEEAEERKPPAPLPPDPEVVAEIVRHMRETAKFEVEEELVRNVLSSLRTDRFITLVGKTGTGKTEFVKAFARGLEKALAGTGVNVHLVDVEVGEETAEHDLIGYRSLDGAYVRSSVIERLGSGDPDRDLYLVLLDEMNLAPIDTYAGKLIASIENNLPIDLPGHEQGGTGSTTSWLPPRGACIVGTMNSYLEDPTRKMLSRPVMRRTQPIEMPDVLEQIVRRADTDASAARALFGETCRLLLDQRAERLQEIGTTALDGDRVPRLHDVMNPEVLDILWDAAKVLAGRPDVAMTLGPLQDALEYVQTGVFADPLVALDLQITQKLLPMLRGDAAVIDVLDAALPDGLVRTKTALAALRELAEANQKRIKPRF